LEKSEEKESDFTIKLRVYKYPVLNISKIDGCMRISLSLEIS